MMNDHFSNLKGYEDYNEGAKLMVEAGMQQVSDDYLAGQVWGTPEQVLEKIRLRREAYGDYDILMCVRFAGTPYEVSERTLRTFAAEVMPEIRSWNTSETMAA